MSEAILLPERHAVVLRRTWLAIFLLVGVDAAWMYEAALGFPRKTLILILVTSVVLAVISFIYRTLRRDDAIWLAAQVACQMIIGSCALGTFNYLGLLLRYPLNDALFESWDQWLNFDWLAYVGWVDSHPQVARIFTLSYILTSPEIVAIMLLLCFQRRFIQFHRYALGFLFGGFVTIFIANFWPATTAYLYRHIEPEQYPHLQIGEAIAYGKEFFAMRDHAMHMLPEIFQGLVAFPSFHCVLAVLAIVAACSMRWRLLAWAIVVLNVIMIASTPVDGGHYLVDSISGIILGILTAMCAERWLPHESVTRSNVLIH